MRSFPSSPVSQQHQKQISPNTAPYYLMIVTCVSGLLASGCATNAVLIADQAARIDSLRAVSADLDRLVTAYQDSIGFYEFIDSGEFVQEMRFKQGEINRLEYTLAICRDGGSPLAIELVDDLFEPASARLTKSGFARLDMLADTIRYHTDVGQIHIEGHSDSTRPIGDLAKRYPTNWDLSAARAAAIATYFVESHEMEESLFRIVSFGSANPVATNGTPRGRRLNRRIRITVVPGAGG